MDINSRIEFGGSPVYSVRVAILVAYAIAAVTLAVVPLTVRCWQWRRRNWLRRRLGDAYEVLAARPGSHRASSHRCADAELRRTIRRFDAELSELLIEAEEGNSSSTNGAAHTLGEEVFRSHGFRERDST